MVEEQPNTKRGYAETLGQRPLPSTSDRTRETLEKLWQKVERERETGRVTQILTSFTTYQRVKQAWMLCFWRSPKLSQSWPGDFTMRDWNGSRPLKLLTIPAAI